MTVKTITPPVYQVISHHAFADVLQNSATGQKSLNATLGFKPGDRICDFHAGIVQSYPTYLTVQTGEHTHITLQPDFLQYINHSCEPNVFFDTGAMQLCCLRPISPGDELTFFYPSTEWDMAQPFVCNCGTPSCLQLINGAAHLSPETMRRYRLTDFISGMAAQQKRS